MSLLLPVPTNLRLPVGTKTFVVEQDMYDICERVRTEIEGGDCFFIVLHEEPNGDTYYTVMEQCSDGVDRVAITRIEALDARVLERLRYIMAVPLSKRMDEIERLEKIDAARQKEEELEELYERMGGPMWSQLEHDGFVQRPKSYAKVGVTSRGKRAR